MLTELMKTAAQRFAILSTPSRMRARFWLAHPEHEHTRLPLARGASVDRGRPTERLSRAPATARDLWSEASRNGELGSPEVGPGRKCGCFQREGKYWAIGLRGNIARLRDVKGLRYIAHLLRHPGVEVHAAELAGVARDDESRPIALGDAGEVLDARARESYRRRMRDLREELAEAERWNDVGRAERARGEIEALASELRSAIGLGGRPRRASSDAERARLMVTQRIKAALRRISEASPVIGAHLSRSIRTGIFCRYEPDRANAIEWEL